MSNKPNGCWVFNQDQLARALLKIDPDKRVAILDFLTSETAASAPLITPTNSNLNAIRGGVLGRVFRLSRESEKDV